MYGEQTFEEMTVAADPIVAAIPGTTRKPMPGANHIWDPQPTADELARFVMATRASR